MVPYFRILSREEEQQLTEVYGIDKGDLPKMVVTDPVAQAIGAREGDILKVIRKSRTAGQSVAYRHVVGRGMGNIRNLRSMRR
jgi:DNA-directed RNA polymerase subunit H (RpoH/RPB5)